MYQARILDKNRQIKAVLPGVQWSYSRQINQATEISINIPRETVDEYITPDHALYGFFAPAQPFLAQIAPREEKQSKTQYAEIAAFIQIYKGGHLKVSGKINSRTLGQVITIQAYTEEILLETNHTPTQYGKAWDGWDLADVARDLLDGWQAIRVKDQSQWQSRITASSNVDLATNPGTVMLKKQANGRYYESGYITLLFNKSEIVNFKNWDRVRWSADSGDKVKTSIQYSTNGTTWSAEFDGGFPEEIGYYIGGTYNQVWVRLNLSTTDTESEDPEGNPVGVTPFLFAVEIVARTYKNVAEGNIPASAGVTVKGLSADYASAFNVLVSACDQTGWEFTVWEGSLNLAEHIGVDRSKDFVLRAGTNTAIKALGDNDEELVNILTAYGPGRGINRMEIILRDEASIAEFGEYPLAMEFDADKLPELEQKAQEFLDEHNSPKTQFEVSVSFDFDNEPDYGLGDRVRVVDPETGIITTTRIMAEAREFGENGITVNLDLGSPRLSLNSVLSKDKPLIKPLDPIIPTGVYATSAIKGLVVGCAAPKKDWRYTECHLSTTSNFTPAANTLISTGRQTRFDVTELTPGARYYAKLIHVDDEGRKSPPSAEVSAIAGHVKGAEVEDDSITAAKYKEILNILPWTGECILDAEHPYEFAFEIPDDTIRIQQIKFSASGERFRSYSQTTESADIDVATTAEGGEISTTSEDSGVHKHTMAVVTLTTTTEPSNIISTIEINDEAAGVTITDNGHSHSVGAIGGTTSGDHSHQVSVDGAAASTSSGVGLSGGTHKHTGKITNHDNKHEHSYQVPAYTSSEGGAHSHSIVSPRHAHGLSIPAHNHAMVSGIYESTTPDAVFLYWDDGAGYSELNKVALNIAPDVDTPYVLAAGLDLTHALSGKGYKRIKLISSRPGRILFQILAKLDIVAR